MAAMVWLQSIAAMGPLLQNIRYRTGTLSDGDVKKRPGNVTGAEFKWPSCRSTSLRIHNLH